MLGGPIGKMARKLRLVPDFVLKGIHLKITERSLGFFRKGCDRISYANCHIKGVSIKNKHIKASDGLIFRSEYMKMRNVKAQGRQ